MKKLLIILFLVIFGGLINAQEITINQTYYQSTKIDISQKCPSIINAIALAAKGQINDKDGLIRMVLISKTGEKILLYEAYYPLVLPKTIHKIKNCEESDFLKNFEAEKIDIQIEDAVLSLDSIYLFINKEDYNNKGYIDAKTYRAQKIYRLNTNLMSEGFLWYADETEYSKLHYENRIAIFGENTNTHGAEYYAEGIFSAVTKKPESSSSKNSIHYVPEFDWRTRHGADKSSSPYFDGNPDFHGSVREYGNGWMTSIKNQLQGGCNATCFIFAPLGAVEGLVNLYYNQHIDVDLSEQHVLSCDADSAHWYINTYGDSVYYDPCQNGGSVNTTLSFVKNTGVVNENCYTWQYGETSCNSPGTCSNPDFQIKISNTNYIGVSNYSNDQLKQLILEKGPASGSVYYQKYDTSGEPDGWGGHAMCLVGYEIVKAGDTLWQRGIQGVPENYTVPEGHELIGATTWIFKNATTINAGRGGYRYYVIDGTNNYLGSINTVISPYNIIGNNYEVLCRDEDNDGYYNWGIGPKPDSCPTCPDEPDCDDSNPFLGPFDDRYGCTLLCENFHYDNTPITIDEDETWYDVNYINQDIIVNSDTLYIFDELQMHDSASITVKNGGVFILGENATLKGACNDTIYSGNITVEPGGILKFGENTNVFMNSSGSIFVDHNQTNDGKLIVDKNFNLQLLDNSTYFEIKGELEICDTTTFTYSGDGYIKFSNPGGDATNNIFCGTNASFVLQGSGQNDKIMEVQQSTVKIDWCSTVNINS
jgi:hypothetical protein